ncbi:MAG: 30S ribosomal protein S7 [Bacteroidetes bacterium]|nr:30S ribosomal protein S7 [Bacteroidota bacterium]MBR3090829.1 30S ribosomal protein S7 [Bacteroidota bacterium]
MRKRRAEKRIIMPDPKYGDVVITKFINNLMYDGKKNTARKIMYDAMDIIAEKTKEEPLEVFKQAMTNVAPLVEVRSRRVGGATYQIPIDVREERRQALAIRWLKTYARARRDNTMSMRLANELMAAAKGEGSAVKRKDEMHRMAEANKAFSHFKF